LQHNIIIQKYNAYTGSETLFKETIYCPKVKFIVKLQPLPPKFIPDAPDTIAFLEASSFDTITGSVFSLAVPKLLTDSSFSACPVRPMQATPRNELRS
jgi:hypothetical protein